MVLLDAYPDSGFFRKAAAFKDLLINTILLLFVSQYSLSYAEPFVTARLEGQLGNQLFQIAAATSLAIDHGAISVFPDLIQNPGFNIPLNYSKVLSNLNIFTNEPVQFHFTEPHFPYSPIPYKPNMCIQGWFQSELYFIHNKDEILKLFAPSKEIDDYLRNCYHDILSNPCTVSIHFRSYLKEDPNQITHPTLTLSYFQKAIAFYPEDALFIVCSNDIEWCKNAFTGIPRNFVYIENEPHYHDLYLMSMCHHNIIANSSFSWWSAYLNSNANKIVIAPRRWFNPSRGIDSRDVIPKEWIAID